MQSEDLWVMLSLLMPILELVIWAFAMLLSIGTVIITTICNYKIFKKAGYEGWEAIVPFYNNYVLSEITMGHWVWFLLLMVPCASIIVYGIMQYRLGMAFGKSVGFNIGLIILPIVFVAILAFEKGNTYRKLPPMV